MNLKPNFHQQNELGNNFKQINRTALLQNKRYESQTKLPSKNTNSATIIQINMTTLLQNTNMNLKLNFHQKIQTRQKLYKHTRQQLYKQTEHIQTFES